MAAAQRLFDKFRQAFLCTDARTQALCRSWPLLFDTVEGRGGLLHGRIATLRRCFLAHTHEHLADQRLKLRVLVKGELITKPPYGLLKVVAVACTVHI